MYKRILLPLDGSAMAEQALPYAIAQAEHFQAELILMKVLEPVERSISLPPAETSRAEKVTRKLACEYLEGIAAGFLARDISVRVVTVTGQPHEGIVLFAEEEQVDLIVICTHGHSGLTRWLVGSVADRVTRGVNVPVLLVRARKE
jgi:nucleotide-binding universal stress UspA family protein